jgi:hypothetical protein
VLHGRATQPFTGLTSVEVRFVEQA